MSDKWWCVTVSAPDLTDHQREVLFDHITDVTADLEENPLFEGVDLHVLGAPELYINDWLAKKKTGRTSFDEHAEQAIRVTEDQ